MAPALCPSRHPTSPDTAASAVSGSRATFSLVPGLLHTSASAVPEEVLRSVAMVLSPPASETKRVVVSDQHVCVKLPHLIQACYISDAGVRVRLQGTASQTQEGGRCLHRWWRPGWRREGRKQHCTELQVSGWKPPSVWGDLVPRHSAFWHRLSSHDEPYPGHPYFCHQQCQLSPAWYDARHALCAVVLVWS